MKTFNQYNHYIGINSKWRLTPQEITKLQTEGITQKVIAKTHRRTDRTIRYWKQWKGENLQKRGRKLKIAGNILELLLSYDENNNAAPLREVSDYLFKETGQRFSIPTIFRALERVGKTRKKATKQHINQNEVAVKRFIAENSWLLEHDSLLAVDECGFNLGAFPYYARANKGERAIVKRPTKRGKNHTLILCVQNINQKAVIHHELIKEGSANTQAFHDFLEKINTPKDKKHYLLLDNASSHRATDKRVELKLPSIEEQTQQKNIELRYLPAYTPELNPTEKCFNVIKHSYRQARPRTIEELELVIEQAIEKLRQKDLTKYFRGCFDYESWHKKRIKKAEI